jgi:hypothetical protein
MMSMRPMLTTTADFRLMTAPDGMNIEPSTGLITWMPLEEQIGTHTVTVVADDGRNGLGGQTYSLTVNPPNAAPTATFIQPATGASIEEGRSVTLQVAASDSDGRCRAGRIFRGLRSANECLHKHRRALERMHPRLDRQRLGEHTFHAIASDNEGASTQSETVTVTVVEPLPIQSPPSWKSRPPRNRFSRANRSAFSSPLATPRRLSR